MFITNIVPVLLLTVSTNAFGLPDDVIYNHSRFKRATDEEFSTSIKQMEMISRVINGISLQQGLSKGSITNEELISELLNLKDIESSDIEQINTEELKQLVEGIQKLSKKLSDSKISITIEKRLDTLNSFVNTITNVEKVEKPGQDFLDAVTKLKESSLKWEELEDFATLLSGFHKKAKLVEIFKKTDRAPLNIVKDFHHETGKVMDQDDLSSFEVVLSGDSISKTRKNLGVFPKVIETVREFERIQNELSYDSKTDVPEIKSLENIMNVLENVFEKMWNDLEIIRILEKLFIFRNHRSGNHDSKLIPGFSSDTSELGLLSNDLKDEWMRSNTKQQAPVLEKVFQRFNVLKEKTEQVEKSIGTSSDASFTGINLILSQVEYLSQFGHITSLPAEALKNVLASSVEAKKHLPSNHVNFEKLYNNMVLLCNRFTSAKEVFKIWKSFGLKEKENKLSKLLPLAKPGDKNKAAEQLKKLQNDGNFKEVFNILQKAVKHIESAKTQFDLKGTAESVVKDYKEMKPFVEKVSGFLKAIEPMRQFSKLTNGKSVFKNIGTIKSVITKEEFGEVNIDSVVETIGNTKTALKELDDTITSMKQAKGNEIDGLVGITDASENARHIGSATKAVSSMNKFLDLDTSKLEAAVKKLQQDLSTQGSIEDQNTLKALAGLIIQIPTFKREIKSFKNSVQPITSSKLSDYSEIFEKAKSVKGIARNFLALSVSVGKLANALPTDKKVIGEIKELLVNMDKLCLKSLKYQAVFDGSKNTLSNIDLLFTNLNTSIVSPPAKMTGTQKPIIEKVRVAVWRDPKVEPATWSPKTIRIFCLVLITVIMILITLGMLYYVHRRYKKVEEKLDKEFAKRKLELDNPKDAKEIPKTPASTPAVPTKKRTSSNSK